MKKTLVIGASLNPLRYSNIAVHKLVRHGNEVKAMGLKVGTVAGVPITNEILLYKDIDTITLYLNPKRQAAYYDYILSLNPARVLFNPGTENPEFYQQLKKQGIHYEEACTLVLLSTNQY